MSGIFGGNVDLSSNQSINGNKIISGLSLPLAAPITVTATATTGGTLSAGTYYYKIVGVDINGNFTPASAEVSATVNGASTNAIALTYSCVGAYGGYRIYRGTSSNNQSVYFTSLLNSASASNFTDTGSAGTSGTVPTSGNAYNTIYTVAQPTSSYTAQNTYVFPGTIVAVNGQNAPALVLTSDGFDGQTAPSIIFARYRFASTNRNNRIALYGNLPGSDNDNFVVSDGSSNYLLITGNPNGVNAVSIFASDGVWSQLSYLAGRTYLNELVLGKDTQTTNTPIGGIIRSGSKTGTVTNVAGSNLTIAAGCGTGNATPGDLVFQTGDVQASGTTVQPYTTKVTLKASGNVGIGTASPSSKLHVAGDIYRTGNSIVNGITYYDQQSAPSSPNTGDRWTERDSSNNVVQEWFWNGTYWLSTNKIVLTSPTASSGLTASGWALNASIINTAIDKTGVSNSIFLETVGVSIIASSSTVANGDWTLTFGQYANLFSDTPSVPLSTVNAIAYSGYTYVKNMASYNKYFSLNSLWRFDVYCTKNAGAGSYTLNVSPLAICRIAR